MRMLRRLLLILVGGIAGVAIFASPAVAHPTLVATLPEAGYSVATPPEEIGLVFDERVTVHELTIEGQARGDIQTSELKVSGDGMRATVQPEAELPEGRYTVRWRATGVDGHDVDGTFGFGVGDAAAPAQASTVETPGLATAAVLRWAMFAALAVALGGLVADAMVRRQVRQGGSGRQLIAPRPWILPACVAGAIATVGLAVQSMGGGSLTDGVASFSISKLLDGAAGRLIVVELGAFVVAAVAARAPLRRVIAFALVVVIVADGMRSHLQTEAPPLGSITVIVHLGAVAIWVGALLHIARTAMRWWHVPGQARALFVMYAMVALGLFGIVVTTGTIAAILVLPTVDSLWTTSYGQVLLVKLALVTAASALALSARRRLRRHSYPGTTRSVRIEWPTLVAVLAASAVLSSMAPPADPAQGLAYPPPTRGPNVRLGTLAGQITTGVIASEGQLEVRLRLPEWDPNADHDFDITGTVSGPDGESTTLELEPCGAGCFVSPARWGVGVNELELDVRASNWQGDAAEFDVPWPARDAQDLFDQMLATMTEQRDFIFVESATSDSTTPTPFVSDDLRTDGPEFVDLQPYRSGAINAPTVLSRDGNTVEIGFAISAESIYVRQTLDASGRIIDETLISPNHLLERTYTYPSD